MSKYWSRAVHSCQPYTPGEQPRGQSFIKLNTNENPYPPAPSVLKAIKEKSNDSLRLYPDPECLELRQTIAEYYGLDVDAVFCGNGSDEVLAFAFQAFFDPGREILFPKITYTFYPVYASLYNLDYHTVDMDENFNIQLEKLCSGEAGGIILANPNAPTGKFLPLSDIRQIIMANPQCVVIVDEAYIDFGGESALKFIQEYPNLLVIQTFSKSRSLAGLRVGFACGHKDLITALNRIKNSFNSYPLDRLAQVGAIAAIKDQAYFEETRQKVIKTRETVVPILRRLGFRVIDSLTNFVFISHNQVPAEELFQRLREKGILVRHYSLPRINNYLRVTIGTETEMVQFCKALEEILS
ncbi:MAG: histidinol-phosphate transaminase [Peptococcia bacterium]